VNTFVAPDALLWGAVYKVAQAENNINILPHLASNNV